MKALRYLASVGCSATALMASSAAYSQPATPAAETASSTSAGDEIVVTAQKREERLQDVPLTVTVVSPAALDRQTISNVTDLQNTTPELNFVGQPSSGYSIRGSGTQTFTRSSENNVLLVVDGVVQGQLTPPTSSLYDIERVEVLSGPQGLLFGKNASAGVVNIVTVAPKLNDASAKARLTVGEDGYLTLNGLVNLPLGTKSALRLTGISDERNGELFNRFNNRRIGDRSTKGVRARFLTEPTERLTINVSGDYEKEKGGNTAWVARIAPNTGPTSIGGRLAACGVTPGPENTDACLDGPLARRIESSGAALQADLDLPSATLTSITGYRHYERFSDTDSDTRPINALNSNAAFDDIDQLSQEIRIASPSGQMLEYVAGLFFYDYDYASRTDQGGTLGALPFVATRSTLDDIEQKSSAVFGQANLNLTDQFTLIAGGRYTWDKLTAGFRSFVDPTLGVRFPGFTPADTTGSVTEKTRDFSYRLGAQYRPNDDVTLFATYTEGYKGPAINNLIGNTVAPRVVRPERPTNIEAGIKAALLDRRVNVDFSVFHTDVKDFQAQTVATGGGLTQFVFTNADKLKFRGAQLNVYARPAEGLSLTAGVLYNHAEYGNFTVPCNAPYFEGCTLGAAGNTINARGRQLANAPRWKISVGGGYETGISNSLNAFVDGNVVYRSSAPTSPTPDPNLVIGSYALVDARIGVRAADDRWSIALFAKNLFDERAPTLIFRDPLVPTGNYMQSFASNAFRVLGVTADVSF